MLDLIAKRRAGEPHTEQELSFIARAAATNGCPDYQLSAWLMAAVFNELSDRETLTLTRAMAGSGSTLSLSGLGIPVIDKHSTGGVGDGISIPLAPLVACAGVAVPMMSGRGLGHTGGTLDKLESIPGFKVRLALEQVTRQLERIGVCMFGQTDEFVPADRKLYALRDATATVGSVPLIVASILSKKVAEGLNGLVLDVKCGSGAIFKSALEARSLGKRLVRDAKRLGMPCVALLTDMEQPLGRAVGNSLEVEQAIDVLKGAPAPADYRELLLTIGGWMLKLARKARDARTGAEILERKIRDGSALERFRRMIAEQGGDASIVDQERPFARAAFDLEVRAARDGVLARLDARAVGEAAVALGAGRVRMEDSIDPAAGILLFKKLGDRVRKGDVIATLHAERKDKLEASEAKFKSALAIAACATARRVVLEVLR